MRNKVLQVWVIVTAVYMLVLNGAANAIPLNGQETGTISDRFTVLFTPAGYVFAIWGVIYSFLLAFVVYQSLPKNKNHSIIAPIRGVVGLNFLVNGSWMIAWHYEQFFAALVLMAIILGTLIYIYLKTKNQRLALSTKEKLIIHVPFSIYMGWISVASIASVTNQLWLTGWRGEPVAEPVWTAIILTVAVIVAYIMARTRGDAVYLLVFVWAFVGIATKYSEPLVIASASVASIVITLMIAGIGLGKFGRSERQVVRA